MKRVLVLFLSLFIIFSFVGCEYNSFSLKKEEQEHLYWKDINVEVVDIYHAYWYATTPRHQLTITVYSEEYDLKETFIYSSSGMMVNFPNCANSKVGDIVKAELYSWVIDSTGEVTRRQIHQVY